LVDEADEINVFTTRLSRCYVMYVL